MSSTLPALQLLVLGSNVSAEAQLTAAVARLSAQFAVLASSVCKRSAAADGDPAPPYLNQAVLIETALAPSELKPRLREIEASLGRVRPAPQPGLCAMDIDLVAQLRPAFQVWDHKSWLAPYARDVIRDLLSVTQHHNIEGFVQPDFDTV